MKYFVNLIILTSLTLFTAATHAITVTGIINLYDDPNNYLGLSGVSLGQTVEANFSISQFSPDNTFNLPPNYRQHVWSTDPLAATPSSISINGNLLAIGPPVSTIIGIFNDDVARGDAYTFQQNILAPASPFNGISWIVALSDSTDTVHTDLDLYDVQSTNGFELIDISIAGITLTDPFAEPTITPLLTAQLVVSQVPLPAGAWLFGTALIALAGIKRAKY